MKFKWLSPEAVDFIDDLLRFEDSLEQCSGWIATDILRKLGVEERREAVAYLNQQAPSIMTYIRKVYPTWV